VKYDPNKHHRRSIRLKGYDYSSVGAYFITICAYQRACLFGEIVDGMMQLNEFGQIVADEWLKSSEIRREIALGEWVVMPNHIHGIVFIQPVESHNPVGANDNGVGANGRSPLQLMKPRSISSFIAGFKSATTKHINIIRNMPRVPVWQRNYHKHIIRNQALLEKIRQYVQTNLLSWNADQLHPDNPSKW
jgi:REP element-mobilizing transposase RayT